MVVSRYLFWSILLLFLETQIRAATINIPGDSATIQAGINGATDFDTVIVASGTYSGNGNRDLDFAGKSIVLRSESGPGVTTIDCGGSVSEPHQALRFHNGEDSMSVVNGFTMTNGYWYDDPWPYDGGIVQCSASAPAIVNCVITGNTGNGIFSYHNDSFLYGTGVRLDSNIISNNVGCGVVVANGRAALRLCDVSDNDSGGVALMWQGSLRVSQSVVSRNGGVGCQAYVYAPSDFIVDGSTVFGNYSHGVRFYYEPPKGGAGSHIYSLNQTLIAFNNGSGILVDGLLDFSSVDCSNSFGNGGDDWEPFSAFAPGDAFGNLSLDPLFCDTAQGDYRLMEGSPCLPPGNSCGALMGAFTEICGTCCVTRGDANHDGSSNIDISDLTYLVDYTFTGGPPPPCMEEGDVNGSGAIDISDLVYIVDYAFTGGPPPPPCGK